VGSDEDRREQEHEPHQLGLANHRITSRTGWSP
jgi:hypothetical protein